MKARVKRAGAKAQHKSTDNAQRTGAASQAIRSRNADQNADRNDGQSAGQNDGRNDDHNDGSNAPRYACQRQNEGAGQYRDALHPRRAAHERQAKRTTSDVRLLKPEA
ncbi:hypothetical protein [Achromobacter spanius]|uniref:hypothetical protein n=1 Tax=Achromobacter spanius TaxID=217203 RepID=UPI0021D51E3E|nr:hypothetical protein [Achromobacter spanius]